MSPIPAQQPWDLTAPFRGSSEGTGTPFEVCDGFAAMVFAANERASTVNAKDFMMDVGQKYRRWMSLFLQHWQQKTRQEAAKNGPCGVVCLLVLCVCVCDPAGALRASFVVCQD